MPRWPSASVPLFATCVLAGLLHVPRANTQVRNQVLPPSNSPAKVSAGWVGSYGPNGRFKADPKHVCSVTKDSVAHARPAEVPGWLDLQDHSQAVVEDLAPPRRSVKTARMHSGPAAAFHSFMAFAYGRDALLRDPSHLALDSKHRLIVVDAGIPAVHILDDQVSFRIAAGADRRLQRPNGIAVDAEDNLYVTDSKAGIIQVYDRNGVFLHTLGIFHGEPIFQEPTAIAIDPHHRRLFVLDTPVHELMILDLEGNVLRKIGGRRRLGGAGFDLPTEIALQGSHIAVLDRMGTRLHLFDITGNLLHVFQIGEISRRHRPHEVALGLDTGGNVYVSDSEPGIRIYDPDGKLLGRIGNCEHAAPGMWIDEANRAYIADPSIGRVNVLQLSPAAPMTAGAAGGE